MTYIRGSEGRHFQLLALTEKIEVRSRSSAKNLLMALKLTYKAIQKSS